MSLLLLSFMFGILSGWGLGLINLYQNKEKEMKRDIYEPITSGVMIAPEKNQLKTSYEAFCDMDKEQLDKMMKEKDFFCFLIGSRDKEETYFIEVFRDKKNMKVFILSKTGEVEIKEIDRITENTDIYEKKYENAVFLEFKIGDETLMGVALKKDGKRYVTAVIMLYEAWRLLRHQWFPQLEEEYSKENLLQTRETNEA